MTFSRRDVLAQLAALTALPRSGWNSGRVDPLDGTIAACVDGFRAGRWTAAGICVTSRRLAAGRPMPSGAAAEAECQLGKQGGRMTVAQAQRDVRVAYLGGFMGQLVSGFLWLSSAALATWGSPRSAILMLVVGGFFIFPLTRLGLWLLGQPATTVPGNPLNGLAMQVAFVLPLSLPVVGAAALYRLEWFYPAFMIVLGAHYLPFVFLYGMRMFAVLCAVLVSAGLTLGLYLPQLFSIGAWVTAALLLLFALLGRWVVQSELASRGAQDLAAGSMSERASG